MGVGGAGAERASCLNNPWRHAMQRNVPGVFTEFSGDEKGRSVPCARQIRYCLPRTIQPS